MNDDYSFFTDRRRFVKGTGSLVALGTLPAYLNANPAVIRSSLKELQQRHGIALFRGDDIHSLAFADTLAGEGLEGIPLTDDPVRQWRQGLGEQLIYANRPILGLTSWADYFVIRGLAAEQRKYVMLEIQHEREQPGRVNWPANLAARFLDISLQDDRAMVQALTNDISAGQAIEPGADTIFSWLIA